MANRDLQLSSWYVTSVPKLRRAGFLLLVLSDLLLVILTAVFWAQYIVDAEAHEQLVATLTEDTVQYASAHARLGPPELLVTQTALLTDADGVVSLAARVKNPSTTWVAESIGYAFTVGGQTVATGTTQFLQGEERFLVAFNVDLGTQSAHAALGVSVTATRWRRILDPEELPVVDLTVEGARYRILTSTAGQGTSQVTGTIVNGGVVGFPSVQLTALLMNGSAIVGAGQITIDDIPALDSRSFDLRFFETFSVTNVLVSAAVDVLSAP